VHANKILLFLLFLMIKIAVLITLLFVLYIALVVTQKIPEISFSIYQPTESNLIFAAIFLFVETFVLSFLLSIESNIRAWYWGRAQENKQAKKVSRSKIKNNLTSHISKQKITYETRSKLS